MEELRGQSLTEQGWGIQWAPASPSWSSSYCLRALSFLLLLLSHTLKCYSCFRLGLCGSVNVDDISQKLCLSFCANA